MHAESIEASLETAFGKGGMVLKRYILMAVLLLQKMIPMILMVAGSMKRMLTRIN